MSETTQQANDRIRRENNVKLNKFYIGGKSIATSIVNGIPSKYAYAELRSAIEEAKHKLITGNEQLIIVVEIKAIVFNDEDGKTKVEYE